MNSLGLRTEWRVIQGTADFFSITKKMHNALQSGGIDLSSKKEIFEQVIYENSVRNFLDRDFVIARSAAAALNGFLVSSVEDAPERIVQLINNRKLRDEMGRKACETVREKFLLTHYLEHTSRSPRRAVNPASGGSPPTNRALKIRLACLDQFARLRDMRFGLIALEHAIEEPNNETVH